MVRNEYHSECFCRASHYHAQCSLVLFAMKTPSMSSWMFACPHRLLPSQVHATSRGKSMTLHIGCHFQRRLCPCDGFLVGIRPSDSSAEPVALKRCRIFLQFLEAAMHSSGLFRTRGASVEAFILRLSRIRDFVLKHRFLHLTRNSLWGKVCVHERHSVPPVFSG